MNNILFLILWVIFGVTGSIGVIYIDVTTYPRDGEIKVLDLIYLPLLIGGPITFLGFSIMYSVVKTNIWDKTIIDLEKWRKKYE